MMTHRSLLPLLLLPLLGACYVGKENVMFFTTTSIGIVDGDTAPPKLSVGYDRLEGSVGPVSASGEALPLLSGIAFSSNPFLNAFGFGVSTTFATGSAAVIGTKYAYSAAHPAYTNTDLTDDLERLQKVSGTRLDAESVENSKALDLLGCVPMKTDSARRYFFATDTSLGLNVSFAAGNVNVPEALSLGWKRKELAIVPVTRLEQPGASPLAILPALVATSTASVRIGKDAETGVGQLYATGMAANHLMARPEVRAGVLARTGAGALQRELDTLSGEATVLRAKERRLLEAMGGEDLDAAREAALGHGFQVEPWPSGASDATKREGILDATATFNDEDAIERLEAFVQDLESIGG